MKMFIALAAVLAATTAQASPMWRDLDSKMTEADVKATLGKEQKGVDVQHYYSGYNAIYRDARRAWWMGHCYYEGPGRTLSRVELSSVDSPEGTTADMMEQGLVEAYGAPLSRDVYRHRENIGFTRTLMTVDEEQVRETWKRDDVLITLERQVSDDGFNVTYQAVPDGDLKL